MSYKNYSLVNIDYLENNWGNFRREVMVKKIISIAKYEGISLDSGAFGVSIVQYWEASGSDDGICLLTLNNKLGLWWD